MITYTQVRIAQSRWALSFTAAYAVLVCAAVAVVTQRFWLQIPLLAISTLMMVELNNANSLIRIYSRMVSCSFLVMITMATFLIPSVSAAVVELTLIVFYLYFLRAYQSPAATGWVFSAFFALGAASIPFVQVLFFVPVLWVLLATNVLAFSARTFFASLLGIIGPYWFVGAYCVLTGNPEYLADHFLELAQFGEPFDYTALDTPRLLTLGFVLFLAILGSAHFLIYSYLDKIRIRMIYEIFITIDVCCIVFILLQPQHFDKLMAMIIVTTAPLIGHYLALSHSRISNICFFLIIAMALAITAFNLWIPSLLF